MAARSLQFLAAASTLCCASPPPMPRAPFRADTRGGIDRGRQGRRGDALLRVRNCGARPQIRQDVIGGDVLRTNAIGNLAILFADQTQIRVGRNSTLTVNAVAQRQYGTTELNLQAGNIWARAARGGRASM